MNLQAVEAVLFGVDGVSDFDGLHSGKSDDQVRLYAFDCLVLEGDDLRRLRFPCARPISPASWRCPGRGEAAIAALAYARGQVDKSSNPKQTDR